MGSDDGAEIRGDARDIAADVLGWRATEDEWQEIGRLVDALIAAMDARDWPALRTATAALEVASPLRVTRLGDERRNRLPPPEPVRERVNRLVHEAPPPPAPAPPR
jgi:hypothetical protein